MTAAPNLAERSGIRVDPDGTIHACAWCWPGESVRDYAYWTTGRAGGEISHGICEYHRQELMRKRPQPTEGAKP